MKLQGIIAKASKDRINIEGFASHEEMADAILSALTASGYRILGPGERDAETLEAAADAMEIVPSFCDGKWAARHIRALKDKRDG